MRIRTSLASARRLALGAALTTLATPRGAAAQQPAAGRDTAAVRRDTVAVNLDVRSLPPDIAVLVHDVFDAPGTLRATGSLSIEGDRQVKGDVAVLGGPLVIAGRVTGRVVAVDADVTLRPGARIDGDLIVVRGEVTGRDEAMIGGDLRVYHDATASGTTTVSDGGRGDEYGWRRPDHRWVRSDLRLASARAYNRVEGLPIYIGPNIRQTRGDVRSTLQVYGIIRSADNFAWTSENLGHSVRGEVRLGRSSGVAVGGRLFDVVDPVEGWQLPEPEVGLASFFLHRDYRDYFDRHGAAAYTSFRAGPDAGLTLSLSDERWGARRDRDPFTLFRNAQPWRTNPMMDAGRFHVANATFRFDTRNNVDDPRSGWFLTADYERGTGRLTSLAPRSERSQYELPSVQSSPSAIDFAAVTYGRGFLDLRRYNRIGPDAQINLRGVLGGQLGANEMPLERRLSVGGPGTLPGYDFRRLAGNEDVLQCSSGDVANGGRPAECDRVALVQAEYRGRIRIGINLFGDGDDDGTDDDADRRPARRAEHGNVWHFSRHATSEWVVFADAGRGWRVGDQQLGRLQYERGDFPALSTFKTDVGIGLDTSVNDRNALGLYLAKAVTDARLPLNFLVRVRKRF